MQINLKSIKRRETHFSIVVSLIFILLIKLPLQVVFQLFFSELFSSILKVSIIGAIIIFISVKISKKSKFSSEVALHFRVKNILFFILPFLYPGILAFANYHPGCIQFNIPLFTSLFIIMIKALCEELVFRGIILGNYIDSMSSKVSSRLLFKSAIYFSLVHSANLLSTDFSVLEWIAQIIYAFYMGILFSAILINTRNIWILGFVHGLLNFLFSLCISQASEVVTTSNPVLKDYFLQVPKFLVLFSPVLLFYVLLLKFYKRTV